MKLFPILFLILFATANAQQNDTLSSALEEELRLIGEEDLLLTDPVPTEQVQKTPTNDSLISEIASTDTIPDTLAQTDTNIAEAVDTTADTTSLVSDEVDSVTVNAVVVDTEEVVIEVAVEEEDTTEAVEVAVIEEAVNVDISTKVEGYRSPMRAMIFSGIIPGTGQAYAKKYWKTGLFVTLETAGIVGAVKFKNTSEEIEQDALKYINSDPDRYNELMDSSEKRANWSKMMIAGIVTNHLVSALDAFISTKQYNRKLANENSGKVANNISLENQLYYSETGSLTTGVSLAWRF